MVRTTDLSQLFESATNANSTVPSFGMPLSSGWAELFFNSQPQEMTRRAGHD